MTCEILAIMDSAAGAFVEPFTAGTLEMALRGFREHCETEGTQFNKHPEDFSLFHVGTFDQVLGTVLPVNPVKIATASQFLRHGPQIEGAQA